MLTDMTPSAGQFYGSQIPTMGMNIANIATHHHIQKPPASTVSFLCRIIIILCASHIVFPFVVFVSLNIL